MRIPNHIQYIMISIWGVVMLYSLYNYFLNKTSLNEQFFDAPLLFVLDEQLTIINESNRLGGNKYIELKFSKNVNENDLVNILRKKGWVLKSQHPLLLEKESLSCKTNKNYIKFSWK